MSDLETFGFGENDRGMSASKARLKMEKNQKARISFIYWQGLETGDPLLEGSPRFVHGKRHFKQNVGYVLNQGPEYTKLLGDDPKVRINTIVVKWPILADGKVDAENLAAAEVMYWVMDAGKYEELKTMHGDFPLSNSDVLVTCTDSTFQKLTLAVRAESVLQKLLAASATKPSMRNLLDGIFDQARAMIPGLKAQIGQTLTIAQIREKLGMGSVGGGSAGTSASEDMEADLESMLAD